MALSVLPAANETARVRPAVLPVADTTPLPDDPDCRGKRIGILIVAYNAITTLAAVLRRIPPIVLENLAEIAVFDDTSPDETYLLAHGYKTVYQLEKLTIHRNKKNLGYGGNQKAGFQYFIEKGFDIVVLLHGDGQYAPEHLSALYAPLVRGEADAVFGSRMMRTYGGALRGGMPLYKYAGNRILSFYENRALGMQLTEFHSGYRAYDARALQQIALTPLTNDFHFDTEIILKLHHQRFRIAEVPIPTYYGNEICRVNGLRYAWDVTRAIRRYRQTLMATKRFPEFAEYQSAYPLKSSRYSSHDYLFRLVGTGANVLDLGCGDGDVAAELAARGNQIVGVDRAAEPRRRKVMKAYFQTSLENGLGPLDARLATHGPFDIIVLADVLEHLSDPVSLLRECSRYLKPGGCVIVSVPNVANLWIRLNLLVGRFQYTERGILDRTHLRFFTLRSARALARDAGYRVRTLAATIIPIDLALRIRAGHPVCRLLTSTLALLTAARKSLLGYQFIMQLDVDR
jgi:2-polyprenyl-3-methyl-5-hydroxy-6-metoxy-1,4-benzoquinol methylase